VSADEGRRARDAGKKNAARTLCGRPDGAEIEGKAGFGLPAA